MIYKTICSLLTLFLLCGCDPVIDKGDISQEELMSRISHKSPPLIVDVRSKAEFESGHVPTAINIPFNTFNSDFSALNIANNKELVVYCESGKRAKIIKKELEKQGFFEVRHLQGDMKAWRENEAYRDLKPI